MEIRPLGPALFAQMTAANTTTLKSVACPCNFYCMTFRHCALGAYQPGEDQRCEPPRGPGAHMNLGKPRLRNRHAELGAQIGHGGGGSLDSE